MNYPISEEDREVVERARTLVEELIPYEVEAEMNEGNLPPGVKKQHHHRVRELGLAAMNMPRELGLAAVRAINMPRELGGAVAADSLRNWRRPIDVVSTFRRAALIAHSSPGA